jgi:SAM-dependent methyltransferase
MAELERDQAIQHAYYTDTAGIYDSLHVHEGDEHYRALAFMSALISLHGLESVVDVGTGTGRALTYLAERHPGLKLTGVEPVEALAEVAVSRGIAPESIVSARGEALPFEDGSFDAACELGVLHHVREPNAVVREMTRVARRAVFLSDNNRFGWGGLGRRLAKYGLHKLRLWDAALYVKTRGRGYMLSDDDGLAYSYSVFDSYDVLDEWADEILVIPTLGSWRFPLLTADHVLLCALRH